MVKSKSLFLFFITLLFSFSCFSQWTQTSGPEGGSIEEIFKVGNSLIIFSGWGGVYKSVDNGESWNSSNSGFPNNPRIYDSFEDDGILYASVENHGIYISSNQGDSWTSISPLQKDETSYYIFVDGNNIYGGLAYGGIIYSPDRGVTWQIKKDGITNQFVNLHVHNSKLYAKRNNKLYETQDHGDTWVEITVPGISPNGVSSMATHNDMLFIADGNTVFFSQDGLTWSDSNAPSTGGGIQLQSDTGILYLGTGQGEYYYLSEIGGSWTQVQNSKTKGSVNKLLFFDNSIFMASSGGVYKTVDNGTSWTAKNSGIKAQSSNNMASNTNYVFASGNGGIYRTDDNGQNWTLVNNGFYRPVYPKHISDIVTVGNTLFVSTFGGIYSSTDNGDSWEPKYLSSTYSKHTGHLAYDNGVLVTSESGTGVLLSSDMGETWTLAQTEGLNTDFQYISMLIKGDTIVLGTYYGQIFLSVDSGQSWKEISILGQYDNRRPIDLEYQNDRLYVTTTQGLWISDDLGDHWQPFIASDTQYMDDLMVIEDTIYVATDNGVLVGAKGRDIWYPLTEGMGPKRITKLIIHNDHMFVGTYSHGIWEGPLSELKIPPLDDDSDGIPNEDDLCPNTAPDVPVNVTGCDLIASNAIRIYTATPTCPDANNGSIEIAASLSGYSLNIDIVGEGYNESFTDLNVNGNFKVGDLSPGTYQIAVSIPEVLHEQLFGITINESIGISGKFQSVNIKSKSAKYIVSGSKEYKVNINGIPKRFNFNSTGENEIAISNLETSNSIIISGENDCQGKIVDTLFLEDEIQVYPTVTSGLLSVIGELETAEIFIYDTSGQLMFRGKTGDETGGTIHLDNYTSGLYLVHIRTKEKTKIFKVIKK